MTVETQTAGAFSIAGRPVGPGHPAYIVAEMSGNHNGDLARARNIVEAAARAGADAVKLQTYRPDTLTIDCDREWFRIEGTLWEGRTLYDLYREAATPYAWHAELKDLAESLGMALFSTPFDAEAVDFLEDLDVPVHKVASFESVDLPLLAKVASTGKPVILSTGMSGLEEIREAVDTLRTHGSGPVALLKCTSAYPAPPEEMNLRAIPRIRETFDCVAGLSDHSLGIAVPVAAAALGASIIEKHLTLEAGGSGPDGAFSLDPAAFADMVSAVRTAERSLGAPRFAVTGHEKESRVFRRSLFVVEDMAPGQPFIEKTVRSIRPGYGLHTRHLPEILGRRATESIERGTPLTWALVD